MRAFYVVFTRTLARHKLRYVINPWYKVELMKERNNYTGKIVGNEGSMC